MEEPNKSVLLVEDNDLDAERVKRAFARLGIGWPLHRARDGLEAIEMLRDTTRARRGDPIVLLDLNMPRMNGFEFLTALRADAALTHLPVFVLTTSARDKDVIAAHRHHVAGYLTKPPTMGETLELLETTSRFWKLCRLPRSAA